MSKAPKVKIQLINSEQLRQEADSKAAGQEGIRVRRKGEMVENVERVGKGSHEEVRRQRPQKG